MEIKLEENGEVSKDVINKNNNDELSERHASLNSSLIKVEKDHTFLLQKALDKINKKEDKQKEDENSVFEISLLEHLIAIVCPKIAGKSLKKKIDIYDFLTDYSVEYTDVISFVNTKSDIEKLKYVLLNPKQIALYNLIAPPENPIKKTNLKSKVSILYRYQRDHKAQMKQANVYLEDLKKGKEKSHLDYKLLELLG